MRRARNVGVFGDEGLRALTEAAVDPIIFIDESATILAFNPAAERVLGYRAAEIVGHNVSVLMPSPDREQHDRYVGNYLQTGVKKIIGIGREVTAQHADGRRIPVRLAVAEVVGTEGSRRFVGILYDLTEQRRAERSLREQQERFHELQAQLYRASRLGELGEMASSIAHELNQPLAAVTNYLEAAKSLLAATDPPPPPAVAELLTKGAAQASRAGTIIRRLRDLIGRGETEMAPTDISAAVREALGLALIGAGERGVDVEVSLDQNLPEVPAERTQIQQVVFNLVRNALEAMDGAERRLSVRTARGANACIEVSVTDSGRGLAPEIADRLFTPFLTTKANGMGIGLSICRSIIEAHGGTIGTDPVPGGGTRFVFTLPTETDDDSTRA